MELLMFADPGLASEANTLALAARREGFGVMTVSLEPEPWSAEHAAEAVEAILEADVVIGLVPSVAPHMACGFLALALGMQAEVVLWTVEPGTVTGVLAMPQVWRLAGPVEAATQRSYLRLLDVLELKTAKRTPNASDWRRLVRSTTARIAQEA